MRCPPTVNGYTRYLVSEIVLDALQQCSHTYPQLDAAAQVALKDCRTQLEAE